MMTTTQILLALFSINLAIVFGAGLYETRIVLPLWFTRSEQGKYKVNFDNMRAIDTGRKFWGFVSTGPLTLLTIANLVFALGSEPPVYTWWLGAALLVFLERLGTFIFFIPTAIKLQKAEALPADKVSVMVENWIRLNYIRNAITFIALLLSAKAIIVL